MLAGVGFGGGIYLSTNFGATWAKTGAPIADWYSVATSLDASKFVAVVFGGAIYNSQTPVQLQITNYLADSIRLSWTNNTAATGFRAQQKSDLAATNWTDVPGDTYNYLNLVNLIVPLPATNTFYRLKR